MQKEKIKIWKRNIWKRKKEIKDIIRKINNYKILYYSLFNPTSKRKKEKTKFKALADIIFNKEIYKKEKPIEKVIDNYIFNEVDLEKAFELIYKSNNTWKFIRNITTFLRYSEENEIRNIYKSRKNPLKNGKFTEPKRLFNFEKNKNRIKELLNQFDNVRLLIQLKQIIQFMPENNKIVSRRVQWVKVYYYEDAPYFWIDWKLKEDILNLISEIIDNKIKEKVNNVKIYVDDKIKDIIKWILLKFSSRDTSTQLWKIYLESWSYIPLNFLFNYERKNIIEENIKESKEQIKKFLNKKEQTKQFVDDFFNLNNDSNSKDKLLEDSFTENINNNDEKKKYLRIWILWKKKEENSIGCDLDLSTLIVNTYSNSKVELYYWNPEFKLNWKTLWISSWDITTSNYNTFSTEFIDLDLKEIKRSWYNLLIWYINSFSWRPEDQEIYTFVQIIDEKERILPEQKINIDIDKVILASRIEIKTWWVISYVINLNNMSLLTTNLKTKDLWDYTNLETLISSYWNDSIKLINDIIYKSNSKWIRIWEIIKNIRSINKKENADFILDINENNNEKTINLLKLEWQNKFKELLF